MADAGKPQADGLNKSQMKQYLVPAVAVAAVVVLAGLVIFVSGSGGRKMSDGSDGSASDSGLKEVSTGVKSRDLKEGTGEACPPGAEVKMHYTGWLENGDVFDSTRVGAKATGLPVTFKLKSLIKGWQEGIPGMKAGGIRKLVIAPDKGYGPKGNAAIPGDSTLIFEVELVEFTAPAGAPRPRREPPPSDLTKLSDGTAPGDNDPGLQPLGTGGLKYRDLKVGDGPACPEGATPIMDYTGWLVSGGQPFDSSFNRGEPLDMPLADLIKGWQQGVPGMKVGGIRKLVIPPDLGYGGQDRPKIPANSTLVFEVELLGIK